MKQEVLSGEEFRARYADRVTAKTNQLVSPSKRSTRKNFDGTAAIRSRLESLRRKHPVLFWFDTEYRFSGVRQYRADFRVLTASGPTILIEYDGATHATGEHSTGRGITRDAEKANLATLSGYLYLRFTVDLLRIPDYFEHVILSAIAGTVPVDLPKTVAKKKKKCS